MSKRVELSWASSGTETFMSLVQYLEFDTADDQHFLREEMGKRGVNLFVKPFWSMQLDVKKFAFLYI